MVALFFFYYNFCRTHSTLLGVWRRCAPHFQCKPSVTKRIDKGLILKALGEKVS
jgi:hypothetical protein